MGDAMEGRIRVSDRGASAPDGETARDEALREAAAAWQSATRGPAVAAAGERKESFRTQAMDWEVAALYTPLDLLQAGFDYRKDLGFPGEYPFTRGVEPDGHRARLWTMAQVTGFGKGMAWAKRARYMLDQGLQGLILEYDLPTTNGYDSDNPLGGGRGRARRDGARQPGGSRGCLRSAVRQAEIPDERVQRAAAREPRDDHRGAGKKGRRSG